jgi:regulator of sigma E protease
MGPKLLQHKGKKTTYTLRLILFGGYCSMEGEDKESDDENAFVNKKVWQRIYVVIAGALMNLVLGLVIVLILVCAQNLERDFYRLFAARRARTDRRTGKTFAGY